MGTRFEGYDASLPKSLGVCPSPLPTPMSHILFLKKYETYEKFLLLKTHKKRPIFNNLKFDLW